MWLVTDHDTRLIYVVICGSEKLAVKFYFLQLQLINKPLVTGVYTLFWGTGVI